MSKKIEPYKNIALIYDEVRPSYPEELIQDIVEATNLKPNDTLLEIGAGTGKATIQFAEKGFRIDAIEIGEDMGVVLKEKCGIYPDVSVEIASFEEWTPKFNGKYDMIFCAQAFHWLDINVKYKKCYNLLKEDGYLILFWYNASGDETENTKNINQRVDDIVHKYIDRQPKNEKIVQRTTHSGVSDKDERRTEIETSELFEVIDVLEYRTEIKNNDKLCTNRHINSKYEYWKRILKQEPVVIPPNTNRRVLIDLENYYCCYPHIVVSGGKGSKIRMQWAEALYDDSAFKMKTQRDERMERLIPIALRTLEMCSHETYMDCPYYEQLMYIGDARLQMLIGYAWSSNDAL